MQVETLNKANELSVKINKVEKLLHDTKTQKTEWVTFTFGNGSNRSCVCEDAGEIEIIRSVLIAFHEKKLSLLREELEHL